MNQFARHIRIMLWVSFLLLATPDLWAQNDSIVTRLANMAVDHRKDGTRIYNDSAIYQGMSLKFDVGSAILAPALSKGKAQNYEIGMNWRLKQRFYPTLELGYAQAVRELEKGQYNGMGGFARVGLDINGLKKHPERLNALLVGIRIGTALQQYDLKNVEVAPSYWETAHTKDYLKEFRCDAWGEVVIGCQVQIWEGFQMGWYARLKLLMTRTAKDGASMPYYIPGFGYRDDINWGLSYYIGWMF